MVACLKGTEVRQVAAPEGWAYRNSCSQDVLYRTEAPTDQKNPKTHHFKGGPE